MIKDGKIGYPANWKAEIACEKKDKFDKDGCGAVLRVTAKDLIMMYWKGTRVRRYYTSISCPQCGKHNRTGGVPHPVWKKFATNENIKNAIFDEFSEAAY